MSSRGKYARFPPPNTPSHTPTTRAQPPSTHPPEINRQKFGRRARARSNRERDSVGAAADPPHPLPGPPPRPEP